MEDIEWDNSNMRSNVTEVFVTKVSSDKAEAFREWVAKIHRVEVKFPGFRGMFVQSPSSNQGENWITFLQFERQENLDAWLRSPERKAILDEAGTLINSLESHRVISPYAGWFPSTYLADSEIPVWKQTMIILLVLFPIVMLELKFLSPLTKSLNSSLATFMANAISVSLISWPFMPIAIKYLKWWLTPTGNAKKSELKGIILILGLYILEIVVFWKML